MPDVTDHPDYDSADFEPCPDCRDTGFIEESGAVTSCPRCEAVRQKYKNYLPKPPKRDYGDGIPF